QRGLNRFHIEVQADAVDVDSVQAGVAGDGEILSVQYRKVPIEDAPDKDISKLEDKKERLTRKRLQLRKEKTVAKKQIRFLDSIVGFAETDMPLKIKSEFPTREKLAEVLEFLSENYEALAETHLDVRHQIKDLDQEIRLLDEQLKNLRKSHSKTLSGIEVVFGSYKDQPLTIEASYLTRQASWEPVYKVDVPRDLSGITLTQMARVHQKTGENWQSVKLSISNAAPLKGASLPDPQSWFINHPYDEMLLTGGVADRATAPSAVDGQPGFQKILQAGESQLFNNLELSAASPKLIQTEQKELPLAFEYDLLQPVTLITGNGDAMLPLSTNDLPCEFFHYTVPQNDPRVYLVCRSASGNALLAGQLSIHFGGRYMGRTDLAEKKAGEDLLINLGVESGIKIKREQLTDKINETRFGKMEQSSVAHEMEYRITIENLNDNPVQVQILDSIPVSTSDCVQIMDLKTYPEPTLRDYLQQEGVMLWILQVDPQADRDIRIKFFVKHPKNSFPWGL
ncbi:MAG: mucoidy inhibitor MuiA family protein, partial [Desulfobacterales bacterium]